MPGLLSDSLLLDQEPQGNRGSRAYEAPRRSAGLGASNEQKHEELGGKKCGGSAPSPAGATSPPGFVAKATPVAQIRRALLEARAAEDEATAIRSQVRPATVEPAQPAIDTAAIYAARNQHCR